MSSWTRVQQTTSVLQGSDSNRLNYDYGIENDLNSGSGTESFPIAVIKGESGKIIRGSYTLVGSYSYDGGLPAKLLIDGALEARAVRPFGVSSTEEKSGTFEATESVVMQLAWDNGTATEPWYTSYEIEWEIVPEQ